MRFPKKSVSALLLTIFVTPAAFAQGTCELAEAKAKLYKDAQLLTQANEYLKKTGGTDGLVPNWTDESLKLEIRDCEFCYGKRARWAENHASSAEIRYTFVSKVALSLQARVIADMAKANYEPTPRESVDVTAARIVAQGEPKDQCQMADLR